MSQVSLAFRRKIAYVNFDCFAEVDMAVLPYLVKHYEILWISLQTKGGFRYPTEKLQEFAEINGLHFINYVVDYRNRSLKSLCLFMHIVKTVNNYGAELLFNAITNVLFDIAALWLNMPCVKGIHDYNPHSGNSWLYIFANQLSIRLNRNQLYYSDSQHSLMKKDYPNKKSIVAGFPLLNCGKPTVRKCAISEGVKFLFFGRIESYKGLDLLIDSFEELIRTNDYKCTLSIYGCGSFWNSCKSHIFSENRYNLQIRFIDSDEIPNIFATHHFLVLPYKDATQSGPCSLALNYNLPVIAPRLKCFIEQCPENASFLYDQGNIQTALLRALNIGQDEYNDMCMTWSRAKENYSVAIVAGKYISFFDSLL